MPSANRSAVIESRRIIFEQGIKRGLTGTQAAIEAGYSPKTAKVQASQLLTRLNLRSAADAREAELVEKSQLRSEEVMLAIKRVLLADPRKLFDARGDLRKIHELDDDTALAISSIDHEAVYGGRGKNRVVVGRSSKVRLGDRMVAADKAARILGLFERDNAQKSPSLAIQVNVGSQPGRTARDDDD